MKRRRKRKLFGKRNHYRQPIARKLSTGLENLERRALLTGLVGWGEVIDGDPGIEKEEVAFEKISQTGDQGHFQKQASMNLKKLKTQKDQQERQATFKQAELDFADFEMPNGRDYQQRQGISGDYYFTPHSVYEGAWNFRFKNHPNSHHQFPQSLICPHTLDLKSKSKQFKHGVSVPKRKNSKTHVEKKM